MPVVDALGDSLSAEEHVALETQYSARNYEPLPVVVSRGEGVFLYDAGGKRYYDFISAYSAVNQGHCHPKIVAAMRRQVETLTLTSRALYNDSLGVFARYLCRMFRFDKVLPMNTGVEAVETAVKICRRWGYQKKGIPEDKACIVVCKQNFHGRTTGVISFSSASSAREDYGPFLPGFESIPYNDPDALQAVLERNPHVAGFLVEPIQGEGGVHVPDEDYMAAVRTLCDAHRVLLIADEIQTGLGRTGSLLRVCGSCRCAGACERQSTYVRPDILILGKALSGGLYPVSAVLCDDPIMEVITPGSHGSTFSGNPLACVVSRAALEVLQYEKLAQNARKMGVIFRKRMEQLRDRVSFIRAVRGAGLMNALVLPDASYARRFCSILLKKGLLAKTTQEHVIRMAPPLVISEGQMKEACTLIEQSAQVLSADD